MYKPLIIIGMLLVIATACTHQLSDQDIRNAQINGSCYDAKDTYPKILGDYNNHPVEAICYCADYCPKEQWHVFVRYVNMTESACIGTPMYGYAWGKQYLGCNPLKEN